MLFEERVGGFRNGFSLGIREGVKLLGDVVESDGEIVLVRFDQIMIPEYCI